MGRPRKTHCLRGHKRTAENVSSSYACKLCTAIRNATKKNPEVTKMCVWCGAEFTTRRPLRKYCSERCIHRARRSKKVKTTEERRAVLRLKQEKRDAWKLAHPGIDYTHGWWGTLSPAEKKEFNRRERLKDVGWTLEAFAAAKEYQRGCCAICGDIPEIMKGHAEGLCADHKHVEPPVPRELLCNGCNAAIGHLKESPERCEKAAAYLHKWS